MTMEQGIEIKLPVDFKYVEPDEKQKELESWLRKLCRSLEDYSRMVYYDADEGVITTLWELSGSDVQLKTAGPVEFQSQNITGVANAKAVSFSIGANTLTTTEWTYLDGQDQSVFTTSDVTHNDLILTGDLTVQGGNIDLSNQATTITLNDTTNALNIDSNTFVIDASNNRVGIGTSTPNSLFNVVSDGYAGTINAISYREHVFGGGWFSSHARGTEASPAALVEDDYLAQFLLKGYDGNSWESGVAIIGFVDGAVSDGEMLGRLELWTRASGAGNPVNRFTVKNDGMVHVLKGLTVGSETDAGNDNLRVEGTSTLVGAVTCSGTLEAGAITGTSFTIGANTLDTNEWAYLDGLDQSVATTDSPAFVDLTLSGNLAVNGGTITSTGDLTLDPAGLDVLIDGGLTVGSTTQAGDNNLRVEGTSILIGDVDIGATAIADTLLGVYLSTASAAYKCQVNDFNFTGSGNLYGAKAAMALDVDITSTLAKNTGAFYGLEVDVNDDSTVACGGYGIQGINVNVDSDHSSVYCRGIQASTTGLGINQTFRASATGGTENWAFYAYAGDSRLLTTYIDDGSALQLRSSDEAEYGQLQMGDQDFTISMGGTNDRDILIQPASNLRVNKPAFFGDGGTTNYSTFAADGELTLYGTARVYACQTFESTDLSPGASGATETQLGNYVGYAYTINDDTILTFPIEELEGWEAGTDVTVNIRYYINEAYATNSGETQWQAAWSACPSDATEAVDAPTHTGTIDSGDFNIPATAKFLKEETLGTIAGASLAVGDEIGITLKRVALDGGSNPTAEPVVTCIGCVYTRNKLGTAL